MDPITAFSLAGTILQFIDTGLKFTFLAFKLYRASSGDVQEPSRFESIATDLTAILPGLQSNEGAVRNNNEQSFDKLARDCGATANKLLTILSKIKPTNATRKRDAIKAAIHAICKEEEIRSLQTQLTSYRDQLNLHLLLSLREHASRSIEDQKSTLRALNIVHEETTRVGGMAAKILDYLVPKDVRSDDRLKAVEDLKQRLVETLYANTARLGSNTVDSIKLSPVELKRAQKVFLNHLKYESMIDRQNRIAIAHETTLRWVFPGKRGLEGNPQNEKWSDLQTWLESDDQLYWITGKAGSGKSTLMKYLCSSKIDRYTHPSNSSTHGDETVVSQQPSCEGCPRGVTDFNDTTAESRCHPYLQRWAGSSALILASFYFWNSGEEIQMTQDGLLRTLLHKILFSCPDLIAVVAPEDWDSACLFGRCRNQWNTQGLYDQLVKAISCLKDRAKICFFIDGLDEFGDNHEDLILMVKMFMGENDHVKVCVASRPWTIFQTAFDQKPSLRLEDLTHDDILQFVRSNFHAKAEFDDARRRYPAFADQLTEDIVTKALGVFLWVEIVTKSLLAGMRLGDRIQDLQRRLDDLPPDLEKLYDKILHSLDPFYLDHAAQYFALVEQAEEPLTILQFSFADEDTAESAADMTVRGLSEEQMNLRAQSMSMRLNNRCKGLLEIDRGWQSVEPSNSWKRPQLKVQYLHRTVRDYIKSQKANDFLKSSMDPKFDAATQLCVAYVLDVKVSGDWQQSMDSHKMMHPDLLEFDEPSTPICKYITRFFKQAASSKAAKQVSITKLINDLRELVKMAPYKDALSKDFQDYTSGRTQTHPWRHSLEDGNLARPISSAVLQDTGADTDGSFLALAVALGITDYVRHVAPKDGLIQHPQYRKLSKYPLLMIALSTSIPNPEMVQCLLDMGADPNYRMSPPGPQSPWLIALSRLPWALQVLTDPEERVNAEIQWKKTLKLLYGCGGYLAETSEMTLAQVSKNMLREVREEMDSMLPARPAGIWTWFGRW